MKDEELKLFDSYARGVLNAIVSNPFISEKIFDTLSEDAADDWIAEKTIKITKQFLKKREALKGVQKDKNQLRLIKTEKQISKQNK